MKRATYADIAAWRARSKPLRKRSPKMAGVYVERRKFVRELLSARIYCEFTDCKHVSVDVHEVTRRSHGGALYPGQPGKRETTYYALCRAHHDYVTTHPEWARAHGYEVR